MRAMNTAAAFEGPDPRGEHPVFAADLDHAWRHGGPLARGFIEALPAEWAAEAVVVDSTLVWLRPGLVPGEPLWHREVYPREARGAYGRANDERAVRHRACAYGVAALPELLVGAVAGLPVVCGPGGWDARAHRARDAQIEAWRRAGRVSVMATALGVTHAYDGETFVRETPAAAAGFRFWIRATHGSARPRANGLRNVSTLLV